MPWPPAPKLELIGCCGVETRARRYRAGISTALQRSLNFVVVIGSMTIGICERCYRLAQFAGKLCLRLL